LNSILKRLSVAVAADLPLAPVGLGADLVFYRERPGVIEIVRVIHGRRNIPDILDEL
jgi:plasmid stabilization system protein ParE